MRQLIRVVILGVCSVRTDLVSPHMRKPCGSFQKELGARGLHQRDEPNPGCTQLDVTLSELHLFVPALRVAEGQAALC